MCLDPMRRRQAMLTRRTVLNGGVCGLAALASGVALRPLAALADDDHVVHTDDEWRKLLSSDQYDILRQDGTERPGSSPLLKEHRNGIFACAGCNLDLFSSTTKFESHTGWPSFWAPLETAVVTKTDKSFGMVRDAVTCRRCESHLGHVFDDGPQPTGLRYCMNGLALTFKPA